jgi:hypothetical protein
MSISLTHGIDFSPYPFSRGLNYWSSGNGTPANDTYDVVGNSAYVPADQTFGGCLEIVKNDLVQKLRFTGQTQLMPETYLLVKTRVKVMAGGLPAVRIAAWAGDKNGNHVAEVTQVGPSISIENYGEVYDVSAILGPGLRHGVDMVWGAKPTFGHFGIDITGPTGAVLRVDDITIEDVSHLFQRDALNIVDVRDYGAIGDGVTDNFDAFVAADQAANGRRLVVPAGDYAVTQALTLNSHIEFQGRMIMPESAPLIIAKSYNLPTYIDAFKDEALAFKKAFQALLNSSDHDSLDLGGRTITVTEPIDMQAAVANRNTYYDRRVIRNGQFYASGSLGWENTIIQAQATYSTSYPTRLSNVENIIDIEIGSLVTGQGVGREVYVKDKNEAAGTVTLSDALHDADGTQVFTFTRFKYLLDFGGFEMLSLFNLQNIEFQCNSKASGVMLARSGRLFHLIDCYVTKPKHRAITSSGTGCQGMLIDRCHFVTDEAQINAPDRISVAFNINANDAKIRDNWASQFRHFAVISGANNLITGNHFYQGDGVNDGVRTAGIVLTKSATSTTISGNYIDNCFVEWTNEHDQNPNFSAGFGFSSLSIADNVFMSGAVAPWFSYIVVKPYGHGHSLSNLSVIGNNFKTINGNIERVDRVDTTYSDLNPARYSNVRFEGNNFLNISTKTENPLVTDHLQSGATARWSVSTDGALPFGGFARNVTAVVAKNALTTSNGTTVYDMPFAGLQKGQQKDQIELNFPTATKGKVSVTISCDA